MLKHDTDINQSGPHQDADGKFNLNVPGYGLSLDYFPRNKDEASPVLNDDEEGWRARTLLIREACMLRLVEDITNKPEWWRKVPDPEIAAKWKKEALDMDWQSYLRHADFTPNMAEYVSHTATQHQ